MLAGSLDHVPPELSASADFQARAYFNNAFEMGTDGHGRVELVYSPTGKDNPDPGDPPNHVLDLIGPRDSGGSLAGRTETAWRAPPCGLLYARGRPASSITES